MTNKARDLIEFTVVNYDVLKKKYGYEVFSLRKKVFSDRLHWKVMCANGMEFDEYDNGNAAYILGMVNGKIICSVRFIELRNHNMITGTFYKYFKKIIIPDGSFVEASRLFVDKNRLKALELNKYPVSAVLFLSMINYARRSGYEAIYAIVSYPMYLIFKRTGWVVEIISCGRSETENIYFIFMPLDDISINSVFKKIVDNKSCDAKKVMSFPVVIPSVKRQAEQSEVQQPI